MAARSRDSGTLPGLPEAPKTVLVIQDITGTFAENKDAARDMRCAHILPTLGQGGEVVLNFAGVTSATQSFVHACISEALYQFGDAALKLLEFRHCSEAVKEVVATVVDYSLFAVEQAGDSALTRIPGPAIPQVHRLSDIREVVDMLHEHGPLTASEVTAHRSWSLRHSSYRLRAAETLSFVERTNDGKHHVIRRGEHLVGTRPESLDERLIFAACIKGSRVLKLVFPELLMCEHPPVTEVAQRIVDSTSGEIAYRTALRRAKALTAWRRELGQPQLELFDWLHLTSK